MWLIYSTIITSIQKSLRKCSDWITDSVFNHTINISKYNPLAGSNYMKLPKELETPSPSLKKESLINIENTDVNECFKCFFMRYLNSVVHQQARIRKTNILQRNLILKIWNSQSKLEILKKLKKRIASVFVSRNTFKKHIYYWFIIDSRRI